MRDLCVVISVMPWGAGKWQWRISSKEDVWQGFMPTRKEARHALIARLATIMEVDDE